ncbi:MAG TPA: HDOD domain-containing protein [Candidatus Sulfotelmatobacter sp.]|nr:HDOD domain-containing protein [Candidatus Sulfotelmatobacter sp.]
MMNLESIRPKIKMIEAIPTVPAIVQPLSSLLRQSPEQVDLEKIVELVSYDTTIAAQCLRMANSPLFGRHNTETVRSAVLALGFKRVEAILLGCCLNRIVPPDKWSLDASTFWRHSLGCALISSRLAKLIGYPDPEKAYLAGLLHDLGILVNTIACTDDFRQCVQKTRDAHVALHRGEQEHLGFTHCQSGKILAEYWKFSPDVIAAIEFHHDTASATSAQSLVAIVYLSDLLCRLRDLGYGYYESMGVDLAGEEAWALLIEHYPALAKMDLARLTLDIDGAMDEITTVVNSVFAL